MADDLVLVIDVGTGSARACVFSVLENRTLSVAARECPISHPAPDRAEFDPRVWWEHIVSAAREAVLRADRPADRYLGITVTSLRQGFVLVDDDGDSVASGVLNYDRRGARFTDVVDSALGEEPLYRLTGHWSAPELTLPKLLWFRAEEPAVWRRASSLLFIHDWVIYRLCGEKGTNPTMVCAGQMADVGERTWAGDLIREMGLGLDKLPPVYEGGFQLGGLLDEVAHRVGLLPGTPVHVGGGDTQFGTLGVGAAEPGEVAIVAGSTAPIMMTTDRPTVDPKRYPWVSAHLRPGLWAAEMNAGHTGMIYRWFRQVLNEVRGEQAAPEAELSYASLDAAAAGAPIGSGDLLAVAANPRWAADTWRNRAPYTWFNFRVSHGLGHMARSILEGVCFGVRGNVEQLERVAARRFERIVFTGGCASVPLWAQMMADVLGRPLEVPAVAEAAAAGGARLVLGSHTGEEQLPAPAVRVYTPDRSRTDAYERYYRAYLDVFETMQKNFGGEGGHT